MMRGIHHGEDWGWANAPRKGGTSVPATTSQTTTSAPWEGQIPYLTDATSGIFPQASNIASQANKQNWPGFYPGMPGVTQPGAPTYVPLTAGQGQGIGLLQDLGYAGGTPTLQGAQSTALSALSPTYTGATGGAFGAGQDYLTGMIRGDNLNPWSSPGFQNVVNTTLANVMPGVNSSFVSGNRADSGLATAAATAAGTNAVGGLANQFYQGQEALQAQAEQQAANNFLTQQGNQIKAMALAPNLDQATLGDISAGLSAAGIPQQNLQSIVNSAMGQWNYNVDLPFNMLGMYQGFVGAPGYGSTSTSNLVTPYYTNQGANIAAGALGGAGLGASALPSLGFGQGQSALIGALIGGAGSALSDENLKTDIERIGESDSGFPLFLYRYKDDPPVARRIGLIAQDVEKKRPEAVIDTPWGKAVNYPLALAA